MCSDHNIRPDAEVFRAGTQKLWVLKRVVATRATVLEKLRFLARIKIRDRKKLQDLHIEK